MENNSIKDYLLIDEVSFDDNSTFKKMLDFIGSNKRVVDFGCATGYFAKELKKYNCVVTGVDVNQNATKVASEFCKEVFVADLDFVSVSKILPQQEFDVAIFGDVLEHLRNPWKVLEETKNILKPNGFVVASIPNIAHGAIRLALLQGKFEYMQYGILDSTHLRFFTRKTVIDLFEKSGYLVKDINLTKIPIFADSFVLPKIDKNQFSHEIIEQIESDEDADTLQFIVLAVPCDLETKYEVLKERYSNLLEASEQLKFEMDSTRKEFHDSQCRIEETQIELQNLQLQLQQTQLELQNSNLQLKYINSQLSHTTSQLQSTQKEKNYLEQQIQNTSLKLKDISFQLQQTQSLLSQSNIMVAAMQSSKFWKLRTIWFTIRRLFNLVPESEYFTPARKSSISPQSGKEVDNILTALPTDTSKKKIKMFAFISGCPGDAFRYRCQHQAQMLRFMGYSVDVLEKFSCEYDELLNNYQIIVAHRVPHTDELSQFIAQSYQRGIKLVYDTDDLVFNPSLIYQIDAYTKMDDKDKQLYEDGVRRYSKALSLFDYVTVSTEKLKQEINKTFPNKNVVISRNRISDEMEKHAIQARQSFVLDDGKLRIAYFSGTKTHAKDFQECLTALKNILQEFPQVCLMIVGHLEVPEILLGVTSQIEIVPFMPWQDLPYLYKKVAINLAPLEQDNDFTESKSELKYFEAALLSVPTVASNLGAFRVAITDGVNGRLCRKPLEWENALRELIINHKLRQEMGQKAFEDVNKRYLTRVAASGTVDVWQKLLRGSLLPSLPLSVAFLLRAPIAKTGGGYKQIFYLAHYLAANGHDVNIYVEPIAHLAGLTLEQIVNFCEENFGKSSAKIHCGHNNILQSDVAIATNWPTAYTVEKLENTKFKAYFVQDYEPNFYEPDDICFTQAEATYDLPLGIISIGKYLAQLLTKRNRINYSYINFSLNTVFLAEQPNLNRHLGVDKPCSILFFARPDIPRRNFALGVEALEKLYREKPDLQIKLYGMEKPLELPFPYENLGILNQAGTAVAMRSSDIHLSFSMTNISTVVFEAMACGCATVEVDVPPVRAMVEDGITCLLAEANAQAVFEALIKLANDVELRQKIATAGYESVKNLTVENMCSQFEELLQKFCFQ